MHKEKREQLALSIGFFLILLVLIITLFRVGGNQKTNSKESLADSTTQTKNSDEDYQTISAVDLQKKLQAFNKGAGTSILDARPFDDYIQEHIIDSVNIPSDEYPIGDKLNPQNVIIVLGQNNDDENIKKAVEQLKKENFKNFVVLAGGMDLWKQLIGITVNYGDPKSFIDQTKVSYLNPDDLHNAMNDQVPVYIVDVRSTGEFAKGHIAGAINLPIDELEKKRATITEKRVVVVGSNEIQEFQAGVQMFDMLGVQPFVMRTAMPGWQQKGFAVVQN